jgi:lathosterol oxidase
VLAHFTDLPLSLPGLKIPSNLNVAVLQIENFADWVYASLYVLVFYTFKFLALGGVLELTNPIPKTNYRTYMMKKQIKYGVSALLIVVSFTTLFFWKGEPSMPYYGYYATHSYGLKEFLMNVIVYMFCFDTWFWFTHMMFHHKFFWEHVHMMHH